MTLIEFIEIGCLGIAALIMAFDEALRRTEHIGPRASRIRLTGAWRFIPAALVCVAAASFVGDKIGGPLVAYIASVGIFIVALFAIVRVGRSYTFSTGDLSIFVDFRDQHAKVSFTPRKNFSRLRIRLDVSIFAEGSIGRGDLWANPISVVIADLRDVVSGVRQRVPLT